MKDRVGDVAYFVFGCISLVFSAAVSLALLKLGLEILDYFGWMP